jgi:hypothetical protein
MSPGTNRNEVGGAKSDELVAPFAEVDFGFFSIGGDSGTIGRGSRGTGGGTGTGDGEGEGNARGRM